MQQTTLQYQLTTSKAGYRRLDKSLLDMGMFNDAFILNRKAATSTHRGRSLLTDPHQYTSHCGNTQPGNRTSQEALKCLFCGHHNNADINAPHNIRRQNLTLVSAHESPQRAARGPKGRKAGRPLPRPGRSAACSNADHSANAA